MNVTMKLSTGKERSMPEAHAKILHKLGRATYMTRDMVAAVDSAPIVSSGFDLGTEVDSTGAAWDSELHVSTKLQNADGTWRKKAVRTAE